MKACIADETEGWHKTWNEVKLILLWTGLSEGDVLFNDSQEVHPATLRQC